MVLHCLASVAARCCRVHPHPLATGRAGLPAIQAAFISGKTMRGAPKTWKKEAWPYKEKPYSGLRAFFDRTTSRWDENSKIIVVDGPPTAGKEDVARQLADEFEMQYMPPCHGDLVYTNAYGFDQRDLNPKLPWRLQLLDVSDFLKNPYDERMAIFQLAWFEFKLSQYIDALAHMMNTGQGVVMNRSVWSDCVYMEAMCTAGFVPRRVRSAYREIATSCLADTSILPRPHLIVYLDLTVDEVKKRIAARQRPHEANSPALSDVFLSALDSEYRSMVQRIGTHAEILAYDMRQDVPVEHMVDDIEKLNFDKHEVLSDEGNDVANWKMQDWRKSSHRSSEDDWDTMRATVTNHKYRIMHNMQVPCFDVPELMPSHGDMKTFNEVFHGNEEIGQKFRPGFNPSMGESVLFKLSDGPSYRDTTNY